MICALHPYPAYKLSVIEWLGAVPAHWKARRLKYSAVLLMGQSPSSSDCSDLPIGPPFLQGCAEFGTHYPKSIQFCRSPSKVSPIGAILMSVRAPVGRLNIANQEFGIGRGLCAIIPNNKVLHTRLALYQLEVLGHGLKLLATGSTYDAVSVGDVSNQPVVLPPLAEQAAIVRYLDYVDRRVRRCVEAKRKLMALQEEERQAVIHQAVTGGLDPNVPLKPSGVEWLGDVPAHWEVRQLKQVSGILRGKFTHRPRNDPSLYGGPYPFIQTGDITSVNKAIVIHTQTLNEKGLAVSMMFPSGTLVMTIAANIGDVAVLDFEACFPDSVVGFNPAKSAKRDYLFYQFRAMKGEFTREAPINTQGNLNVERIGSKKIALPCLREQTNIVEYLDKATANIDTAIARARRQIELVEEYRTRLIADVVTGKLDVRAAAAQLPDEAVDEHSLEVAGS